MLLKVYSRQKRSRINIIQKILTVLVMSFVQRHFQEILRKLNYNSSNNFPWNISLDSDLFQSCVLKFKMVLLKANTSPDKKGPDNAFKGELQTKQISDDALKGELQTKQISDDALKGELQAMFLRVNFRQKGLRIKTVHSFLYLAGCCTLSIKTFWKFIVNISSLVMKKRKIERYFQFHNLVDFL